MAASWLPALVVVPLAMVGALVVSQTDDEHPELRRLHPLDRGTTWVYAVFDHDQPSGTRTNHVAGRAGLIDEAGLRDVVQVATSYTDQPGVGPSSFMSYVGYDGSRILQFGRRASGAHTLVDPPATAYELPVEEGASWTYEGTIGTTTVSYESTLEEIEDVEVGGRTFRDCAHYVTDYAFVFESGPGDPESYEEWTCPGFGPVRSISTIPAQDHLVREELTEFHGTDEDWRAEDPPAVSTDQVAGSTISFDSSRSNAVADGRLDSGLSWSDARDNQFRFPPAADDELMVIADDAGDVAATDVVTGELRWRLNVAGPVVAPPVIVGDTVLIAAADKTLLAVSTADGSSRWLRRFDDQVSAAPTPLDDGVLVPTDDGSVTAVGLIEGEVRWSADHAGPVRDAPAATEDRWVVADRSGSVTAYDVDGDELWTRDLEEPLAVGPATAEGLAFVADQGDVIYAIDVEDGSLAWQRRARGDPFLPLSVANGAVVAVLANDRVEALELETGNLRWESEEDRVFAPPVIVGDQVVTVSDRGTVRLRDLDDGNPAGSWELPKLGPTARLNADLAPALVGSDLVVGGSVTAPGFTSALFAYPVGQPAGGADGVFFESSRRVLGVTPADEPAISGETVWVPGMDAVLYRSDGEGAPDEVHSNDVFQAGVAIGQGIAVTQRDDTYLAYPIDGGEPLWEFPSSTPTVGVRAAISDDTVFLPQYSVGLAAAELDGTPRWVTPIAASISPTSPLPVPDGDVVFGGAGLARYDGRTGAEEWRAEDTLLPGHPAYAEGVVYADVARDGPSGLGAFDFATGEQLWLVDNVNQLFGGRPAVSDGVVVDADAAGRVFAVDAADGSPLWEVQLSEVPAGSPLVVDGRVYLYEMGRNEDLYQRAVRLSAHDLHTGRFLGAYEPGISTFGDRPTATMTADGRIVIPTGDEFGALQFLEPRP